MTEPASKTPSVSERTVTGAGWVIAWRLATRNLGLISTLILVRLLAPEDFGLIALATGFIASIDALSAIGVQESLVREPSPTRDLYDTAFGLSIVRGALTATIIAAIAWPTADFFAEPRLATVILALAAGTFLSGFENIGIVDFRRKLEFRKEFNLQMWSRLAGIATTIAVAAIWQSYWALVAGILAGRAMRLVQSYAMSRYRPRFTLRAWRRLIGFSLWTWALTLLFQVRDRADSFVVGKALGTTQVGIFAVGVELGSMPTTELVEPINRVLFSSFAATQSTVENMAKLFLGAVGLGFLAILPAGIGISMVAEPLVLLTLGERWVAATPVVQIMSVASTITIFSHVASTLLNATGQPRLTFWLCCISVAVRIPLLIVFVGYWGLPGASLAVAASFVIDLALFLSFTLPRIGVSGGRILAEAWRPVLACASMIAVLTQLDMAWTASRGSDFSSHLLDLAERSAIGAAIYCGVLLAAWLLAGRPDGAENFMWNRLKPGIAKLARPLRRIA